MPRGAARDGKRDDDSTNSAHEHGQEPVATGRRFHHPPDELAGLRVARPRRDRFGHRPGHHTSRRAGAPGLDRRARGAVPGVLVVLPFGSRLSERASERAAHRLRVQVARVVLDPHSRPDSSRPTGETVSVASSDTRWVGLFCAVVPFTCAALVLILVTAVALLRISVPLGLALVLIELRRCWPRCICWVRHSNADPAPNRHTRRRRQDSPPTS